METKYVGTRTREGCKVERVDEGKEPEALNPRLDLWNHSPSGFEWSYSGSGSAQTALAILADAIGNDQLAVALHQNFKFEFISRFPREGFELTAEDVQRWTAEEIRKLDLAGWEQREAHPSSQEIRERAERLDEILASYPDTDYGRLASLLADAQHWAHEREVDFERCLELSKELRANEVEAVAVARELHRTAPQAMLPKGLSDEGATMGESAESPSRTGDKPVTEKSGQERKPLAKLACGHVRGTIWLNQSEEGREYLTVSIARVHKGPDGTTKTTRSFRQNDLPDLSEVTRGAQKFIQEESLKQGLEQQTETRRVRTTR
jgi:hypothetical protein